ncbi:hypothetical protein AcW1_009015 [Taiwanofungus camphoratus]|nr:hypothetical protein AcW1_009015 [Antrodia cinnamomea]
MQMPASSNMTDSGSPNAANFAIFDEARNKPIDPFRVITSVLGGLMDGSWLMQGYVFYRSDRDIHDANSYDPETDGVL